MMTKAGKIQNWIREMERMHNKIIGVSKMRLPNSGEITVEEFVIFYSGSTDGTHEH